MRPVPPAGLYLAKLAVIIGEGALASALMGVLILAGGALVIRPAQPVRWDPLAVVTLVPFIGDWPLLGPHLWLAAAKGFAPTFTVAVGGFLSQMVVLVNPSLGVLSPWTYPLSGTTAALGGDKGPLGGTAQVLPLLGLSLGVALASAVLGAVWFTRSEVK